MLKSIFVPIIAAALFIVLVGLPYQGKLNFLFSQSSNKTKQTQESKQKTKITINNKDIYLEVAKTNAQRSKGLSGRKSLEKDLGMLFIVDENSKPTFWMKDTYFPLDIIWINDDKIVQIDENVPVELDRSDKYLTVYSPKDSVVDYVLEVNANFAKENSIKVGQMISGLEQF